MRQIHQHKLKMEASFKVAIQYTMNNQGVNQVRMLHQHPLSSSQKLVPLCCQ